MGFYGNIFNYISNAFTKFKVGGTEIIAGNSNDVLTLIAEDGIKLATDTDKKQIKIQGNEKTLREDLIIDVTEAENETDNKLIYTITQGGKEYKIDIPLALILKSGQIINTETGTFLELILRTEEGGQQAVYIDVKSLGSSGLSWKASDSKNDGNIIIEQGE